MPITREIARPSWKFELKNAFLELCIISTLYYLAILYLIKLYYVYYYNMLFNHVFVTDFVTENISYLQSCLTEASAVALRAPSSGPQRQ